MPADVLSVYVSFLWEMCALPRFHGDHCPPGLTDEAGRRLACSFKTCGESLDREVSLLKSQRYSTSPRVGVYSVQLASVSSY